MNDILDNGEPTGGVGLESRLRSAKNISKFSILLIDLPEPAEDPSKVADERSGETTRIFVGMIRARGCAERTSWNWVLSPRRS